MFPCLYPESALSSEHCKGCTTQKPDAWVIYSRFYLRLDWVGHRVNHILELARLGPQLFEGTRIVPHVVVAPGVAKGTLVAQMVASGAAYLGHGW